uniref:Transmembrane protein 109 n=1 Tax=Ursus americanus TaxID=9643 RepID=A0A452R6Q0_URSAM
MAGPGSSSPWGKHVFKVILMVLVALVLLHSASSQSHADFVPPGQQKKEAPVDLLSQIGRSARGTLDAWLGPETMRLVSEVRTLVLWAISSGHLGEPSFALSDMMDHLHQACKLSPSQVQTFCCGSRALVSIGSVPAFLAWSLAYAAGGSCGPEACPLPGRFVALVRSVPRPLTEPCLLLALLTLYALLTGSLDRARGPKLEAKVRGAERQVEELRWRQRRAAKGPRERGGG